jgi:hypothetical protein
VAVLITAGCVNKDKNTAVTPTQATATSPDPIVGRFEYYTGALTCHVNFGSDHSFSSDCSLFGESSGKWTNIDKNHYIVTFTKGGSYIYTYYPDLDQISVPTTTPPTFMYRPGKGSVVTTSSASNCAAFIEGKYSTVESAKPFATLETTGGGKAIMVLSTSSGKTTFNIAYSLVDTKRPCDGLYNWVGYTSDEKPASGEFAVIGQNPDKIVVYGAYGGYEDKLIMIRGG